MRALRPRRRLPRPPPPPPVCRLYPLGRQRREGRTIYHQIGEQLPCFALCPTVSELQAARLYLVLALHLGATVGTDAAVMTRLLAGEDVAG